MSLIEKIARDIAAELGMQDSGHPFILADDLTLEYLDQNNVDFGKVAQAALTAIMGEGDGVQDVDREAAATYLGKYEATSRDFEKHPLIAMLARHRALAIAAERARTGWQPIDTAPRDGSVILFRHADGHLGIGVLQDVQVENHNLKVDRAAWAGQSDHDSRPGIWIESNGPFNAIEWMPFPADAIERGEV